MPDPSGSPGVVKGRKVPNLIMEFDNEKGYEFRVQCEVVMDDKGDAARIKEDVATGTPEGLKRAKKLVLAHIDPGATATFKRIVAEAFDDNIAHLDMAGRR